MFIDFPATFDSPEDDLMICFRHSKYGRLLMVPQVAKSRGSRLRGRRREARCGVRAGTGGPLWSSSHFFAGNPWSFSLVIFGWKIHEFLENSPGCCDFLEDSPYNKILGCLEGSLISLGCVWNDPNLPIWWWLLKLLLTWGLRLGSIPNHWDVYFWEVGTTLRITSHY